MQEILDEEEEQEKAEQEGGGGEGVEGDGERQGGGMSYKDRCYQQVELGVDDRFHELLNRVSE